MKTDNIKSEASSMIWARLQTAEIDLRKAQNWNGEGYIGDPEDVESTKQNHINYAKRRYDIYKFILNLINSADDK